MRAYPVFAATFKSWIRSRTSIFFSFLFPMLLLLVFGTVFGGSSSSTFGLFVQNLDVKAGNATRLSGSFIEALNSTNALSITTIPPDMDPRAYAKEKGGAFGTYRILIIPGGFEESAINSSVVIRMIVMNDTIAYAISNFLGQIPPEQQGNLMMGSEMLSQFIRNSTVNPVSLTYIYDPSNQGSVVVRGILSSVASGFNYRLIGAKEIIEFRDETFAAKTFRAVDYYMPGYIAAFIMTNGIIGLTSNVTEYKRRGIVKRLVSSPLRKVDWIIGNIMTQLCIGLMLTAAMVVFGYVVFRIVAIPDALSIAIVITGVVAFSSLGMILGGMVKNVEASSALGNAIGFPMMFLSGSFWPLEIMPPILQTIAKFLPLTYFSDALRNSMIYKEPVAALFNMVVLLVLALVFIAIGSMVTKWRE